MESNISSVQSTNSSSVVVDPYACSRQKSKLVKSFRYSAFVALIFFVSAYSFGFGPVTWILLSEIFPASSKGSAMALATAFNWLGNLVVSGTFIQAAEIFTLGGVFFAYGV